MLNPDKELVTRAELRLAIIKALDRANTDPRMREVFAEAIRASA